MDLSEWLNHWVEAQTVKVKRLGDGESLMLAWLKSVFDRLMQRQRKSDQSSLEEEYLRLQCKISKLAIRDLDECEKLKQQIHSRKGEKDYVV